MNDELKQILEHNIDSVLPRLEDLEDKLKAGEKLRVYCGFDPTGEHLHIGHAMQLMKLRDFQRAGHEVIMLIGSFTAMIGDPTDKGAVRTRLTKEEVMANAATYKEQAEKILSFEGENAARIKFNDEWLAKLTMEEVVELASHFTVQQMAERDMFEKRLYGEIICLHCKNRQSLKSIKTKIDFDDIKRSDDSTSAKVTVNNAKHFDEKCSNCGEQLSYLDAVPGKPVYLHEFMYPLMQGYDSVAMDVDVEVGGSDQLFNMLAGRTLQKQINKKEKFVLTLSLLTNDEGKKMSKSEGGFIAIDDAPEDKYGKIMSMADSMTLPYGRALQIEVDEKLVETDPRQAKADLAKAVVAMFDDEAAAERAEEHFNTVFRSNDIPEDMPEFEVKEAMGILDLLRETQLTSSNSEARRMIDQGAVKIDGEVVTDQEMQIEPGKEFVLQKGKRHFVRVK